VHIWHAYPKGWRFDDLGNIAFDVHIPATKLLTGFEEKVRPDNSPEILLIIMVIFLMYCTDNFAVEGRNDI
jgi:hypothetical protein